MKSYAIVCQFVCILVFFEFQSVVASNSILPLDFDQAMVSDPEDLQPYQTFLQETPHKEFLQFIMQQYYQFINTAKHQGSVEPRIPKIIHQIWIGPYPFPAEAKEWQASWSKMHPDWEYKLWTNEDVEQLDFANKKYFTQAKNWGEKADILRYEILYRFGGVYVDIDFECLKSFDWLNQVCDFYTGIHAVPLLFKHNLRINNGLIAARPGHPIMERLVNQVQYFRDEKGVAQRTGPDFFTIILSQMLPQSCKTGSVDVIFPSNFFYPSGPKGGPGFKIKAGEAYVQPETMAVHYYTAYWIIKPKSIKRKLAETTNSSFSQLRRSDSEKLHQEHGLYKEKKQAFIKNLRQVFQTNCSNLKTKCHIS